MDKIFSAYLANARSTDGRSATLELPATDYELLDALDKIQLREGDDIYFDIDEYYSFEFLAPFLSDDGSIYEVNALARQLSTLDECQSTAFEGLVQMESNKQESALGLPRLIDLAYSADRCHVVGAALNNSELGRFYAENDFIPEISALPDSVFELLDFERLGRKMRMEEGGVFTRRGYVVQNEDLKQVYDTLDLQPHKPDYIFRLLLTDHERKEQIAPVPLDLPATQQQMEEVQQKLGTPDWLGAEIISVDGPLPMLDLSFADQIGAMNQLAKQVRQLDADGKLVQYKAVLAATDCHNVDTAIFLADNVDDYLLTPRIRTPEDAVVEELHVIVTSDEADLLLRHLNLHTCGLEIMERDHSMLSEYGMIERLDGEPILTIAQQQGGMQMM